MASATICGGFSHKKKLKSRAGIELTGPKLNVKPFKQFEYKIFEYIKIHKVENMYSEWRQKKNTSVYALYKNLGVRN